MRLSTRFSRAGQAARLRSAAVPVQLSVGVATFGPAPPGGWRDLIRRARVLEEAGIDRIVVPDHVVLGAHVDRYPWGRFPTEPGADWLEPLTAITAMAASTERVRFLTGILVAGLRPAALLAKTAATVDVVSGGRLDLGVGVGWQPEEFAAVGASFAERGRLLDDALAACRTLWAGEPLEVPGPDGPTPVWCAPRPAQDRLPVWVAGTVTDRLVERLVRWGDGWIPIMGLDPAGLALGVDRLRAALADAGRDPAGLQVRASPALVRTGDGPADPHATLAGAADLVVAGATDLHLPLRAFVDGADDPERLGRAAAALRRAFDLELGG